MFDKLIDWLITIWENFIPIAIIKEYEEGVHLRFGRYLKNVMPGLVWKVPFIDEVMNQTVVVTTIKLHSQSLTTLDKKDAVVRGIIKYDIEDIKRFILDVFDAHDAICDMTQSIIKKVIMERTWEQCVTDDLDKLITEKARLEAQKWGIKIYKVTLTDMGIIRSYRLFNEME